MEILADKPGIDYVFVPVGGGGLSAGVGSYFKIFSPKTKIVGLEPEGAPSMYKALQAGKPVTVENIDRFVDGAAVKRVGDLTFSICKDVLDDMRLVPEGKVCTTILKLYNEDAIVVEEYCLCYQRKQQRYRPHAGNKGTLTAIRRLEALFADQFCAAARSPQGVCDECSWPDR
jgi:D-serine dehydratase